MIVQTGPMRDMSSPAFRRRSSPLSTASATATAWGTEKQTVALMLMPRHVASSMAPTPASVTGILTIMLGARASKWTAWATIRSALRKY